MSKKKYIILVLFGLTCFFVFVIYNNIKESNILHQDGQITEGEIIEFKHLKKSSYSLIYKYEAYGNFYQNSVPTLFFKCDDNNVSGCLGKKFNIIYSKSDPSISDIDLEKYNKYKGMHLFY